MSPARRPARDRAYKASEPARCHSVRPTQSGHGGRVINLKQAAAHWQWLAGWLPQCARQCQTATASGPGPLWRTATE